MADSSHGPASFWTQTDALLRKNIIFQKRNLKTNVGLIAFPMLLCLLLVLIEGWVNNILDKPRNKCGCTCIDINGDGTCESMCGIQYSTMDQAGYCAVTRPQEWLPLLQIPAPEYRAVRTDFLPFTDLPHRCLKGLNLWRNSSSEINDELFKGYRHGNPERKINEIIAAYDFLNSDENGLNVSIWYNSTYKNDTEISIIGLVRAPRSVNLASNAYLNFLRGFGLKMIFEFVKEMPKPETQLKLDFSSLLDSLFFAWIVLLLFPVILTSLVYEKQQNLRIMMKMYGLGDGPYWMISYAYFLFISLLYMLSCVIFGSLIGRWLVAMEIYPGFSLYRGIYEFAQYSFMGNYIGVDGMRWKDLNDSKNGMREVLIIMVVEWLIVLLVAFYLDQVVSLGSGVRKHPLFFLQKFQKKPLLSFRRPSLQRQGSKVHVQIEKADVAQERENVEQLILERSTTHTIICENLKKIYPGKDGNPEKFAVRGLSLAIPRGECFGMLGPNGAGKTSFITMMIGLITPTSGMALVQGLDIRTDMDQIYTSMGVCPQHE
ncbi:hypothetical protein HHK36_024753 [Tetracentron sinense]|uniref:ABC transporter domain-containing protein n=1 Tax=Tetracentron sinense TaxID=13715 RepID=A0A835D4E2_TETSI|nr:hypothetical protein HHK36_024753 [Tetracentron sinense]